MTAQQQSVIGRIVFLTFWTVLLLGCVAIIAFYDDRIDPNDRAFYLTPPIAAYPLAFVAALIH
jgi:hypothetical protein